MYAFDVLGFHCSSCALSGGITSTHSCPISVGDLSRTSCTHVAHSSSRTCSRTSIRRTCDNPSVSPWENYDPATFPHASSAPSITLFTHITQHAKSYWWNCNRANFDRGPCARLVNGTVDPSRACDSVLLDLYTFIFESYFLCVRVFLLVGSSVHPDATRFRNKHTSTDTLAISDPIAEVKKAFTICAFLLTLATCLFSTLLFLNSFVIIKLSSDSEWFFALSSTCYATSRQLNMWLSAFCLIFAERSFHRFQGNLLLGVVACGVGENWAYSVSR